MPTETKVDRVTTSQASSEDGSVRQRVTTVTRSDANEEHEFGIAKINQILWYLCHFIAIILILRFIFLLFGANRVGIVDLIYRFSNIFVAPFRSIFPSVSENANFFDTAALLATVMYYLFTFLISKAIELLSKKVEA